MFLISWPTIKNHLRHTHTICVTHTLTKAFTCRFDIKLAYQSTKRENCKFRLFLPPKFDTCCCNLNLNWFSLITVLVKIGNKHTHTHTHILPCLQITWSFDRHLILSVIKDDQWREMTFRCPKIAVELFGVCDLVFSLSLFEMRSKQTLLHCFGFDNLYEHTRAQIRLMNCFALNPEKLKKSIAITWMMIARRRMCVWSRTLQLFQSISNSKFPINLLLCVCLSLFLSLSLIQTRVGQPVCVGTRSISFFDIFSCPCLSSSSLLPFTVRHSSHCSGHVLRWNEFFLHCKLETSSPSLKREQKALDTLVENDFVIYFSWSRIQLFGQKCSIKFQWSAFLLTDWTCADPGFDIKLFSSVFDREKGVCVCIFSKEMALDLINLASFVWLNLWPGFVWSKGTWLLTLQDGREKNILSVKEIQKDQKNAIEKHKSGFIPYRLTLPSWSCHFLSHESKHLLSSWFTNPLPMADQGCPLIWGCVCVSSVGKANIPSIGRIKWSLKITRLVDFLFACTRLVSQSVGQPALIQIPKTATQDREYAAARMIRSDSGQSELMRSCSSAHTHTHTHTQAHKPLKSQSNPIFWKVASYSVRDVAPVKNGRKAEDEEIMAQTCLFRPLLAIK